MESARRKELEQRIESLHRSGRIEEAAEDALRGYGPGILGYLIVLCRDRESAYEVFCRFSEDIWCGFPGFRWESSFKTWAYTLAYRAAMRFLRSPQRRRERNVPLSNARLSQVQQEIRSTTAEYLKSDVKAGFARLRKELSHEEQTLLTLRVDRGLSWEEIAAVMSPLDSGLDAMLAKKEAARLRQQYRRLKSRLRRLAIEEGIVPDEKS